ncbi:dynein axonemal assembly factor 8 isoform X3 [Acipenser ruthenus]|uniref:dynein axonemal assembly factor 8 isoform X3 n=1 Tax=Acipenser ruthenus TaxID=7906 RepID=UPI0027406699|nr:dynein axonemal assembly factor 8 isoform X3 [Acipenser ruthenus]
MASGTGFPYPVQHNTMPDWDSIFSSVKAQIPSLDSDTSTSDCEEDEVLIFRRSPASLIPGQLNDATDISLGDPELEELLQSVRTTREAWPEQGTADQAIQDDPVLRTSDGLDLQASVLSDQLDADPTSSPPGSSAEAAVQTLDPHTGMNHAGNSTDGANPASPSLTWLCRGAVGDADLNPDDIRRSSFLDLPGQEASLSLRGDRGDSPVLVSRYSPSQQIEGASGTGPADSEECLDFRAESQEVYRHTEAAGGNGLPVLSLELLDQWDLDEVLQNLEQNGNSASYTEEIPVMPVETGSAGGQTQGSLLERLAALCVRQSGGRVELSQITATAEASPEPHASSPPQHPPPLRTGSSTVLPHAEPHLVMEEERTEGPPTVYIDLRNTEPSGIFTAPEPLEETTDSQEQSDSLSEEEEETTDQGLNCEQAFRPREFTGKSLLLQKLRKASKKEKDAPAPRDRQKEGAIEQRSSRAGWTPENRRKRTSGRAEATRPSEGQSKHPGGSEKQLGQVDLLLINGAPQNRPNLKESGQGEPLGEEVPTEEKESTEKTPTVNSNSSVADSLGLERREKQKEQARRQRLQRHMDNLKPRRSVTGRQPAAHSTAVLYSTEASYFPSVSVLSPESENRETLLLTVCLSSPGQTLAWGQHTGHILDMALAGSNVYNTLVTWFLSLVGPVPQRGEEESVGAERQPPFWVAGIQQLWREEGLVLYVCAASHGESRGQVELPTRKPRRRDEERGSMVFYQRVSKYLSQTPLRSMAPWAEELNWRLDQQAHSLHILLPPARLDSIVSVNPDRKTVEKAFGSPVGFYWQTVETEEHDCVSVEGNGDSQHSETEVAMALGYKTLFGEPLVTHHTLQMIQSSSLDICGLRLLYPPHSLLSASAGVLPPGYEQQCGSQPVLALALRGPRAGSVWRDITGPSDSKLATLTDPNSINAMYGTGRDRPLLYSPRLDSRVQWELCVWFGGRVPEDGNVYVGGQNSKAARSVSAPSKTQESRCGETGLNILVSGRPPATLTATVAADVFLVVSPIVPPCCYGDVLSGCTKQGFSLRGLRRLRLSPKRAQGLGVPSQQVSLFCTVPPFTGHFEGDPPTELPSHCLIVLLRRENAWHHSPSLLTGLMNTFAEQGLLRYVCSRLPPDAEIETHCCFHTAPFTESLLHSLGGSLWLVPNCGSISLDMLSPRNFPSNPELEQVVILTLTGGDIDRQGSRFLQRILRGESPQPGKTSGYMLPFLAAPTDGGFELLGLKWLPRLSRAHAREVTPFEVGDKLWQDSVARLASGPALVCALRRVDGFAVLHRLLQDSSSNLDRVVSPTPELAFRQAALFFTDRELIPDPSARPLLNFLPPPNRHCSSQAKNQCIIKTESIFSYMVESPELLFTVAVVKPGVWMRSLAKILGKVQLSGFSVVGLKVLLLDQHSAASLLSTALLQDPGLADSHVEYLTSTPSLVLCLQRENAVKKLLDLLGPDDPHLAQSQDQFLWRAQYGTDLIHNGIYGSLSYRKAVLDAKLFFPEGLCCRGTMLMEQEQILCAASDPVVCPQRMQSCRIVTKPHGRLIPSLCANTELNGVQSALCQTTCLLIPSQLLYTHRRLYIDLLEQLLWNACHLVAGRLSSLDRLQSQHVAETLRSTQDICTVSTMLSDGPCLILALQGDNAVTCFDAILDSICWKRPELEKLRKGILYPNNETQADKLLCCLFESLSPNSQHKIVLQDPLCLTAHKLKPL